MSPGRFATLLSAAICSALLLCGCGPLQEGAADEQKEPHFLEGRSRVNTMDYPGAIDSFAQALEVNPRSSSAHFELGWLYEQKNPDAAAAIYHYERYLKLRPEAVNAETIKQRIQGLKQILAETAAPLPASALQRELERLMEENRKLREENNSLQVNLASRSNLLQTQIAYRPTQPQAPDTRRQLAGNNLPPNLTPTTTSRTHTVRSGDSFASIARRYGVKMESLQAANPRANPKRLQIGQMVNLPAS
jgi:regulator of replication initiation timing